MVVGLACTGATRGEYMVGIRLRYDWPSQAQPTRLHLRRRKICTAKAAPAPEGSKPAARPEEARPHPAAHCINPIRFQFVLGY